MHLVLDIGNTRSKAAVFENNVLVEQAVWLGQPFETMQAWILERQSIIQRCLLSTVAKPDASFSDFLTTKFDFQELTAKTSLPFQNLYETPETLGKDRLAAVAGAQAIFPKKNLVVIDFGTCIKYEWLSAAGRYYGGNIAPGAAMRLKAMQYFTARLPEPPFFLPENAIGNTTETALQNGGLRGVVFEVTGFLKFANREQKLEKIIISGGDAAFFKNYLPYQNKIRLEPDLTLIGLNAILLALPS